MCCVLHNIAATRHRIGLEVHFPYVMDWSFHCSFGDYGDHAIADLVKREGGNVQVLNAFGGEEGEIFSNEGDCIGA